MSSIKNKLTYLNTTKQKMKDIINYSISALPSGYTQVSYIESSGTQYIDTGLIPINILPIKTISTISVSKLNKTHSFLGCSSANHTNNRCFVLDVTDTNTFETGYKDGYDLGGSVRLDTRYNIETYINDGSQYLKVNGAKVIDVTRSGTFTYSSQLYLFARNVDGTANFFAEGKIYNFKIYSNNILVRNFIPCYRNSDNEIGMYDLVNNVFYTNQGTGVFIKGEEVKINDTIPFRQYPDKLYNQYIEILKDKNVLFDGMPKKEINNTSIYIDNATDLPIYEFKVNKESTQATSILPHGYTQVDYIESTGTQYIDSGVKLGLNDGFDIKFLTTNNPKTTGTYGAIFGGRTASGNKEYQLTTFDTTYLGNGGTLRWGSNSTGTCLAAKITTNIIQKCSFKNKIYKAPDNTESEITVNSEDSVYNTYIFGLNNSDVFTQSGNGCRIYYLKLYNGDTLIRDFIPCYRNNDNEIGMYDYVTDTFYTNQGTGNFKYGSVIQTPTEDYPTPSPSYPQEVKTVKGYRNLLDIEYYEKGGIDANTGNNVSQVFSARGSNYIEVLPNTQYTLSAKLKCNDIRLAEYTSNKDFIIRNQASKVSSLTITTSANTKYLRWTVNYNNSTEMTKELATSLDFAINEGAEAFPYVPYGTNWMYNKIVGKNLFNRYDANILQGRLDTDGSLVSSVAWRTVYIKCKQNTDYTISGVTTINGAVYECIYDENMSFISSPGKYRNQTFTTPANAKYLGISVDINDLDKFQIEEGSSATTYEEYKERIATIPLNNNEIVGIGDYKDELIVDKNGHCWLNKKIGKVVLNGSENWGVNSTGETYKRYVATINNTISVTNSNNSILVKSNYFVGESAVNTITSNPNKNMIAIISNNRFMINTIDSNLFNSISNWLSEHHTPAYYVLETEQLIDLNYTVDIRLFNGVNNISNSEDGNMVLQYVPNEIE